MSKHDPDFFIGLFILIGVLAICVAIDVAWNEHVYGDWTCAWSHCVKVKP